MSTERESLPSTQRLAWDDGRIVPRNGDLAFVLERVELGGGGVLRAGQNVLDKHVLEEVAEIVGIKWRDCEGTHVMAIDVSKLEIVP